MANGSGPVAGATGAAGSAPLRFQRLAEMVADQLRERILHGDLEDGDLLPKEEELRAKYPVSKPSIREAMRILEAEGLLTVRRGNVGGSVVHRPSPTNVAYSLSLVLSAERVELSDVARALQELEPTCAALCAARRDRARTVVPELRRLHEAVLANVDDLVEAITLSRAFHETIVRSCGNQTLIIMVGALEAVWSSHEMTWASRTVDAAAVPSRQRRAVLRAHERIIDLIAAGDAAGARDLVAAHVRAVQTFPSPPGPGQVGPVLARH